MKSTSIAGSVTNDIASIVTDPAIAAATGIVIVIQKAFEFLSEALQKNQKIADAISIVFDTISIVMNEVTNVLVDVYENVAKSSENFDALGKVMNGIITVSYTHLTLPTILRV